jgi:ribonuclease-3
MLDFAAIEEKIGYVFCNKALLETALTHVSYARAYGCADNERLEYLGDAVLELLITEKQYFENVSTEGTMTKRRQGLVSKLPLKAAVLRMGVAEDLRYFGGKDNVGDKTVSSLYESLLAAVYLDGGMDAARAFLNRHPLLADNGAEQNYKGDLQEYLQKDGKGLPVYDFHKEGQDNAPTFHCTASAQGMRGEGEGKTKRAAEQQAAKVLLQALKAAKKKRKE